MNVTESNPQGVPFLSRRSMAATSWGGKLYFFAGVGANTGTESILDVSDDLWCFDTEKRSWRQIESKGDWPSPRRCVGWTTRGGQLRLWGGSGLRPDRNGETTYSFLNDEWALDPDTENWILLAGSEDHLRTPERLDRPFPRYTPVYQPLGEDLFLFGGYTEDRLGKRKLNDAWVGDTGRWAALPSGDSAGYEPGCNWPGIRYGCMSAGDGDSVYICGGFSDQGDHIDLWRVDGNEKIWQCLSGDHATAAPEPRYCAAVALHAGGLFLFGGRSRKSPKINFNDLWRFDLRRQSWACIARQEDRHCYDETAARPGYHAKSAVAVCGEHWYIWGGEGRRGHVSDFWRYNMVDGTWEMLAPAREDDPVLW
jgi:hypothetical protein